MSNATSSSVTEFDVQTNKKRSPGHWKWYQRSNLTKGCAQPPRMDGIAYTLQWADAPPQIAHSHAGYGPLSNTQFNGLTRVHNPNDILIGSAVFTAHDRDRPTDRQTTLLHLSQ